MRRELSSLEYSVSLSSQTAPYTMRAKTVYSLWRGRVGSLSCMLGEQTHNGPAIFLVLFCKDQARMNGTPQPDQKWLGTHRIEHGSLDHKPQLLAIGLFLTLNHLNPYHYPTLMALLKYCWLVDHVRKPMSLQLQKPLQNSLQKSSFVMELLSHAN